MKCFEMVYLLNEKYKQLTKRAIQLEKSKSKNRTSNTVATGLGGSM